MGEIRKALPQVIEHAEKGNGTAEMYQESKAEPEPGIAGYRFCFLRQIQLPEISNCQRDHENISCNYHDGLQLDYATPDGFKNDHQWKNKIEPTDTAMNKFIFQLLIVQICQHQVLYPPIYVVDPVVGDI